MRKSIITLVVLLTAGFVPSLVFAEWNAPMIEAGMKSNATTVAAVKKAIEAKDFEAIATGFSRLANNMLPLINQSPPKGSKANWDRYISQFVKNALSGVEAAHEKDLKDCLDELNDLQELMRKGHREFRNRN